jgi:FkbM family methyltransferase
MQDMYTLLMRDDIPICLPGSVQRMTTYIILEQEDWFEDEIAFVRRLILPGMKVMDIGANYGVYTLAMARSVGPVGAVWAFEPASETMSYLRASIENNPMSHVRLVQKAVSNRRGTSHLSLNTDAELNTLASSPDGTEQRETVELVTLDDCAKEFDWSGLAFIKLDAEGEEYNIVKGGGNLLARETPLIMFELKHRQTINLALINQFAALGYETYRLVPGLNLLIPYRQGDQLDPFQLNLFCCKPDRAAVLEERGLLVRTCADQDDSALDLAGPSMEAVGNVPCPALVLGHGAEKNPGKILSESATYRDALSLYTLAHTSSAGAAKRLAWLLAAFQKASIAATSTASHARLQTYARIAWELGLRNQALMVLGQLLQLLEADRRVMAEEPYLAVAPRFENIDSNTDLTRWCLASVLEQREILMAYSSYFMGPMAIQRIELMRGLGYLSAQMERRRQLIGMHHGLQMGPESSPLLAQKSPENLNPAFWTGARAPDRKV